MHIYGSYSAYTSCTTSSDSSTDSDYSSRRGYGRHSHYSASMSALADSVCSTITSDGSTTDTSYSRGGRQGHGHGHHSQLSTDTQSYLSEQGYDRARISDTNADGAISEGDTLTYHSSTELTAELAEEINALEDASTDSSSCGTRLSSDTQTYLSELGYDRARVIDTNADGVISEGDTLVSHSSVELTAELADEVNALEDAATTTTTTTDSTDDTSTDDSSTDDDA